MKIFKPKFWDIKNSIFSAFLIPVTLFLRFIFLIRKNYMTQNNCKLPVICVGNIYLGGTGKTPLTIKLFNLLEKEKWRPAIIRKFYFSHLDEIRLIKKRIKKIYFNKSRLIAIKEAKKNKSNIVILDDGLQDYSIKKDLSIMCFNEKQLIGNGLTIPAGPLREPLKSIVNSQIIVINGKVNKPFEKRLKSISKKIKIYYSKYVPININKFLNSRFIAFAGIGNPSNFFDLLNENKIKIKKKIMFPDHFSYRKSDILKLIDEAKDKKCSLITTEKDYFRIKNFGFSQIKYLEVDLKIYEQKQFIQDINRCIT